MTLPLMLADAAVGDPNFSWVWEIAKTAGPGATFCLGIGTYFIARAYIKKDEQLTQTIKDKDAALAVEVQYSKEIAKGTMTVMTELTNVIKGSDQRDVQSVGTLQNGMGEILKAINDLKTMIRDHVIDQAKSERDSKIIRPSAA